VFELHAHLLGDVFDRTKKEKSLQVNGLKKDAREIGKENGKRKGETTRPECGRNSAKRIRSIALSVSLRFLHILRYLNATVCLCVRSPVPRFHLCAAPQM
jgi:hypothetical protein